MKTIHPNPDKPDSFQYSLDGYKYLKTNFCQKNAEDNRYGTHNIDPYLLLIFDCIFQEKSITRPLTGTGFECF